MEVFELFEALQKFAKEDPVGADKILLEVGIEGQKRCARPNPSLGGRDVRFCGRAHGRTGGSSLSRDDR